MSAEAYTFFVFVVVAIIRTGIDVVIWRFLVWLFKDDSIWMKLVKPFKLNKYAVAQAIAFIISAAISYTSNKTLAFQDDTPNTVIKILKFIIVSVAGLVSSVWAIEFLTTNKNILNKVAKYEMLKKHWPLVAKLLTVGLTVVINYGGMKYWVFRSF